MNEERNNNTCGEGLRDGRVVPLYENRFLKVFDLQYAEGKHYYTATRRDADSLVCRKDGKAFREMLPDAVSCCVILRGEEDRILLTYEYRYPAGRFLLSVPAGLIDPEDRAEENPLLVTAAREIGEECGIRIDDSDRLAVVSPVLFSTPGMTDESNGIVLAVVDGQKEAMLNQRGALGGELFDGFVLLNAEEAKKVLREGRDERGNAYSVYTWIALTLFVTGMWREYL